jgi:nitrite reductase/ring-hydroxylating ferredoxin subunit/uncharacterized membrane protein
MCSLPIFRHIADRIERAEFLDASASKLADVVRTVIRPGPVEDVLSGVPLGHPLHPALVAAPLGAWLGAGVLDVLGDAAGARRLTALGAVGALAAVTTGGAYWLSVEGAEKRVGFVHALSNYIAILAYGTSWWARSRGARKAGIACAVVGASAVGVAGWLGGHLAYAQGVGVDTTAFSQFPHEWTDIGSVDELPASGQAAVVEVAGIPVPMARDDRGWVAYADRCTHRGAPLHEGEISDSCIVCPWHGSAFSLEDGSVRSGPATRPQPKFQTRVEQGRLQLHRIDVRTLRTNPTGT